MEPAHDAAPPSAGTVLAGKYRLLDQLGVGGMGMVFAAINELTNKRVAIKWMLPRFAHDEGAVARFKREARAAGRIDHPNVINVFDVGDEGGCPFLVMELLSGAPLSTAFAHAPLRPGLAVDLALLTMRGVHAAHEQQVLHRDLKPENVFLCTDASGAVCGAKVLDFGISKPMGEGDRLTQTGALMGTPRYMSPEQVRGHAKLDVRSDVYALGVILYEGLTARAPFEAATFTALAVEIALGQARTVRDHVPEVDERLDAAVMKALSRERSERYDDVASFARALEPFGSIRFAEVGLLSPIEVPLGERRELQIPIAIASTPSISRATPRSMRQTVAALPAAGPATVEPKRSFGFGPTLAVVALLTVVALGLLWMSRAREPSAERASANTTTTPAVAIPAPSPPTPPSPPSERAAPVPIETPPSAPVVVAAPAATTRERTTTDTRRTRPSTTSQTSTTITPATEPTPAPAAEPAPPPTTFRTRGLSADEF